MKIIIEDNREYALTAVCIIAYLGICYALNGNVDAALMAVVVLIVGFISEKRRGIYNKK